MLIYTVYCRPDMPTEAIFIKEGFSLTAFLFAAAWFILNKLWLGLMLYLSIAAFCFYLSSVLAISLETRLIVVLVTAFYIGLEANNWRGWELRRNGYSQLGLVAAINHEDAERIWFTHNFSEEVVAPTRKKNEFSSKEGYLSTGLVSPLDRA